MSSAIPTTNVNTTSNSTTIPQFNLSGLASGLDTNAIVTQLMQIESQPLVRLQSQQAVEEARQQALTDVRTRMTSLQTAAAALSDPSVWADMQEVDSSDDTHLVATRTAGAAAGAYTVNVTRLASADQYTQTSSNTNALADDTMQLSVGAGSPFSVAITAGDSLDDVANRINSTTDIPVYATVAGGKLVVSSKTTGDANTVSITGGATAGFTFAQTAVAHDAIVTVDSGLGPVAVANTTTNSITNAIPGVTLTLKAPTSATITVGSPAPDTANIQASLQNFVTQYNSTVSFIQGKLSEAVVANPQSDADRTQGVLNGDSGLESLLSTLRESVADMVSGRPGATSTLSQVGLSTGAPTGTVDPDAVSGMLTLDTTTLTTQLTSNFTDVKALFTNVTGSYASEGLGQRLGTDLDAQLSSGGIMDSRDASEAANLKQIMSDEADWGPRLTDKEAALRAQFTNMEVALQQNQSELAAITAQLNAL